MFPTQVNSRHFQTVRFNKLASPFNHTPKQQLFHPRNKVVRSVQPVNKVVYARAARLSKKTTVEKQKVSAEEESHTVTLVGKVATPIAQLEGERGFWFAVGNQQKSAEEKIEDRVVFMVYARVPEDVFKSLDNDVQFKDGVILSGQMQTNEEFLVQQMKLAGAVPYLDKIPTLKEIYQSFSIPFSTKEEEIGFDRKDIFEHMLNNKDEWWDMRLQNKPGSRRPHLVHRFHKNKAIWLDGSIPEQQQEKFLKVGRPMLYPGWNILFEHPDEFWDNESNKRSDTSPTFIHKATGCSTWYREHEATQEQIQLVNEIRSKDYKGPEGLGGPQDPWENLVAQPNDWIDIRTNKSNPRAPDFRHKKYRNGMALWIDSAPQKIKERLQNENFNFSLPGSQDQNEKQKWWVDLFENQQNWNDYRPQKFIGQYASNYPDFKSKDEKMALWLDSKSTPDWVIEKLPELAAVEAV